MDLNNYKESSLLEFTPLEFETYIVDSEIVQSSELEFTPLEFETTIWISWIKQRLY